MEEVTVTTLRDLQDRQDRELAKLLQNIENVVSIRSIHTRSYIFIKKEPVLACLSVNTIVLYNVL